MSIIIMVNCILLKLDGKIEKCVFSLLFKIHIEGTGSQLLSICLTFCFMKFRKKNVAKMFPVFFKQI